TDPPYNVVIDGHASGLGKARHREFAMASGEMSAGEFTEFLGKAMALSMLVSQPGSLAYYFMDWRHMRQILAAGLVVYGEPMNLCVWAKNNAGMGSFYRSAHELICLFKNGEASHRNNIQLGKFGRYRTNVWNYPSANTFSRSGPEGDLLALHPTPKPVSLIADAIKDSTARGAMILDPFLGSGTAVIAAERTGRVCYGLELDPLYVDALIRRCGLRRAELSALTVEDLQIRLGHWAIVDLVGKGSHVRTVPVPAWVKQAIDRWRDLAKVAAGRIFRAVSRHGTPWGKGISENVIWYVVRRCAERMHLDHLAPHDIRRTCAKLCHVNGGELEQIQFLLGHVSVLTTERYLGCKQNLEEPVNDRFGCLFASTLDHAGLAQPTTLI